MSDIPSLHGLKDGEHHDDAAAAGTIAEEKTATFSATLPEGKSAATQFREIMPRMFR